MKLGIGAYVDAILKRCPNYDASLVHCQWNITRCLQISEDNGRRNQSRGGGVGGGGGGGGGG